MLRQLIVCDQQPQILTDRDEMAVKQPMCCAAQGNAVLHYVESLLGYRDNVRRLRFCAPSTIDDAQTSNGASVVIGGQHRASKVRVPHWPIDKELRDAAGTLDRIAGRRCFFGQVKRWYI